MFKVLRVAGIGVTGWAALLGLLGMPQAHARSVDQAAAPRIAAAPSCPDSPCGGFSASGLDGGSYVPTITVDPSGNGVVLAGSDVGGVYRSTNHGSTWVAANQGLTVGSLSVASLVFSPTVPGKVYAALGDNGPGGVEVSTDDGQTWTLRSSVPQFNGPNPYTAVRASGRRLAVASDGTLYAATSNLGLMRSTDDGKTWTSIALSSPGGAAPRVVVVSPIDPNLVYVANYGIGNANFPAGLYGSFDAEAALPTFTAVPGAPVDAEDLAFVGTTLYVAASSQGLYSMAVPGAWKQLITTGSGLWATVAGYQTLGATPVIYAGEARPVPNGEKGYVSLVKSTDGGQTWAVVSSSSAIHLNNGGPGGAPWWFARIQPGLLFGGISYIPRQIAIDPVNPARVFVAGNADIWATSDSGADWYPVTKGLGTTVERGVAVDSRVPGTAYAIGYDWGVVGSTDGMRTVTGIAPPNVTGALDLSLDPTTSPSTVYVAGFSEFNPASSSDIYVSADPLAGQPWSSLGLASATGGRPILGVAVNRLGTGAAAPGVVLAAVGATPGSTCGSACGIWRKVGSGAWSRVQTVAMSSPEGGFHVSFGWLPGASVAYLYDPASGLWRSNDRGATWSKVWAAPFNHDLTGYAGVLPGSTTVYLSLGTTGVWRLSNASSGTVGAGITATRVGAFSGAGPLTIAPDGSVWVAQVAPYGSGFWKSTDNGTTWKPVADAVYLARADFPTGLAISPAGEALVATRGDGVLISG